MAGLVDYASSDAEQSGEEAQAQTAEVKEAERRDVPVTTQELQQQAGRHELPPVTQSEHPLGPHLPPAEEMGSLPDADESDSPGLPSSETRALIRDLTLPSVPNLDIPPSPPASPPPALTKKFQNFLDLKSRGTHFNASLAESKAMRDPSLMEKLLSFAGLEGLQQYETTLPQEQWCPHAFPEWAFMDELRQAREKIAKERERAKSGARRSHVDFVPASAKSTSNTGKASAQSGLRRGEKRKGRWD